MASITKLANGRRLIQFINPAGERKTIRLGKVSQRNAEAVKLHVENLVAAAFSSHAVDDQTARWVATLDDVLADKLASVGLIPSRERATLGSFIDGYIESRHDTKPSTKLVYRRSRRHLVDYFGEDKPLRDILPGHVDEWRLQLMKKGLADNTIRRTMGMARQYFRAAQRKGLIANNPFDGQKTTVRGNAARFFFVTREAAQKIIDACPDAEWRLLFALSRYGGLRCPSEHLSLKWGDIDWQGNRMNVPSPKTEHHEGGESRQVPIFPELLPHLREVYEAAPDGTEYVITRYRQRTTNLRTQLQRIILRAGL